MSVQLTGLKCEDYTHPLETEAIKALEAVPLLKRMVGEMNDQTYRIYLRTNILGSCLKLTENTAPKVYHTVKQVCETLDYESVPDIYVKRELSVYVTPYGFENPVLVLPNVILEKPEKIFQFSVGRGISLLKSGHIQFYTLARLVYQGANTLLPDTVNSVLSSSLIAWMRKSEISADRGGLLACQDYDAAMKLLMFKAGVEISGTDVITAQEYIEEHDRDLRESGILSKAGRFFRNVGSTTGLNNDRIKELYAWYMQGGYDDLIEKYGD
ncbi:MAG: M48 family metallopeptidase [Lachnospiraceae bacterium]|nr:M48 family metallopeptidase [Lachnospiraceae bacterium]